MKALVIGSRGQLGHELSFTKPARIDLVGVDVNSLDITKKDQVERMIVNIKPDVVINAAAYTDVEKAETERESAFKVNGIGPGYIAQACVAEGCRFIHISTDFVFDGKSSKPYMPDDTPNPLGVYGNSKYQGEKVVIEETKEKALIFRTAWLYSTYGNNFVKTMLRLLRDRDRLKVVYDQVGTPTWARTVATTVWNAVINFPKAIGVYHLTDAGVASWYDLASATQDEALSLGLLQHRIPILPVRTSEYRTIAERPAYSVLDCSGTWNDFSIIPVHWRISLHEMLKEVSGC